MKVSRKAATTVAPAGDGDVEKVVASLRKALEKGRVGQGKIFVSGVDDAVRTRTGERGDAAIK